MLISWGVGNKKRIFCSYYLHEWKKKYPFIALLPDFCHTRFNPFILPKNLVWSSASWERGENNEKP